jgi:hypothetical protein
VLIKELEQEGYKFRAGNIGTDLPRGTRVFLVLIRSGECFVTWSFDGRQFADPIPFTGGYRKRINRPVRQR